MHSQESLREIRALEAIVGDRPAQESAFDRLYAGCKSGVVPVVQGEVVAIAKYDLATRTIKVEPVPQPAAGSEYSR